MEDTIVDDLIRRLVSAKSGRTTKQVQMTEAEIRHLCTTSKEIFLSQPNLLELEAPIKICGILFCFGFSSVEFKASFLDFVLAFLSLQLRLKALVIEFV